MVIATRTVELPAEERAVEATGALSVRCFDREVADVAEAPAGRVLDRDVVRFERGSDEPTMAERITQHAHSRAVRRADRSLFDRALRERSRERGLHIGDVEHHRHAVTAQLLRAAHAFDRVLVREHEHRVADEQLGMTDGAVVHHDRLTDHAGVEHVDVPLERAVGVLARQVDGEGVQAAGRVLTDLGHGDLLSGVDAELALDPASQLAREGR